MAPWRFEVVDFTIEEIDDYERRPEERRISNPKVTTINLTTTSADSVDGARSSIGSRHRAADWDWPSRVVSSNGW